MIRGQANQRVSAKCFNTDGTNFAGTVNVYINGDGAGEVLGSLNGGQATLRARGEYEYTLAAAETAFSHLAINFDAIGGVGALLNVDTITVQQISALQTATGLSSVTVNQLLLEAFIEIKAGRAMDALEPELLLWALGKVNRMFDKWNADPSARYSVGFASYTPTVSHQPHTIGPNSADWAVTQRPDKIYGANLILNTSTPAVRIPITVRDDHWWLNQSVQGLGSAIVTDLYYDPGWPNGNVYLWPIPTATYQIELMTDQLFGNLQMTDTLWLPFGYREAATLTLAELLAPGTVDAQVSSDLKTQARDARAVAFGNYMPARRIRTRDGGMPGGGSRRGGYLYRTGRTKQ